MSRNSEIHNEEHLEELFETLSKVLKEEKRLLKRFYDFCLEYESFDYDESGINMDEGKDLLRKANKIRDLIFSNLEAKLLYKFDTMKTHTPSQTFVSNVTVDDESYKMIVEVMENCFNLELM